MNTLEKKLDSSLLKYYQDNRLNPALINLEDEIGWKLHIAKRNNLYEKHLMIPIPFLKERSVIEFGCNSGENALHLASLGARLTLVEPNGQVLPRLKMLFKKFGFQKSITKLVNTDVAGFKSQYYYDIMIAEGFLNTLVNREEMFLKICSFLAPGGMGIVSFDDRYGSFLEIVRQLVLKRACQLKKIVNIHSKASLELAKNIYGEDFLELNASRNFECWWGDVLVNPFVAWGYCWTYQDFIPLLEKAGCEFYSSSPKWTLVDYYTWYKNVTDKEERHQYLLEDWCRSFAFFLTGLPLSDREIEPVTQGVVEAASKFIKEISEYIVSDDPPIDSLSYPVQLYNYFNKSRKRELLIFNTEMEELFDAVKSCSISELISTYKETKCVRKCWGTPGHFICFIKSR